MQMGRHDDEAARAVSTIILDQNESEILERITRTTQEEASNKMMTMERKTPQFQVPHICT